MAINSESMNPLNRIQPGMHVVDAAGKEVGKVEDIRMGDPEAATTEGNEPRHGDTPMDLVADALGHEAEPDVPEPMRSRLIRDGYLKLDGPNLLAADRYVPARYVRGVADDRVQLSVGREDLIRED
jgi:hypothetical protein